MRGDLISVIVPVYNGEAYIERCIRSVLYQEYRTWELLLVDGASTDGTLKRCHAWQKKDERIRVISLPENQGVSVGRNAGIRRARGEYLFFLDADDWLMPDCLGRLYKEIGQPETDIAGCAFARCTAADWEELEKKVRQGGWADGGRCAAGSVSIAGQDFLQEGILKQDTRCWSKLYRRQVLAGSFFREDYTVGEDMLFLREVAAKARKISCSQYQGYCYYHNPAGTMLRPFRESDMDQIRCWQEVLSDLQRGNAAAVTAEQDAQAMADCASILLVSCMLVVGKLAVLPRTRRRQYAAQRRQCSRVLEETLRIPGARAGLDRGYRLKVGLYRRAPGLYLFLYHMLKSR